MEKPRWRATAAAVATAVLLGVGATDASALALGRVTVQSALGEPLRAEIDIPEITAEEISSLRTSIASPDAFKAAGVEYNPALTNIRITLERRADGRHFLRLVSTRPINDPFVDLILESSWASGRVVRDYTMLLDPPSMRQNQAPLSAETSPAAPARGATPPARASASRAPAPAARPPAAQTPSNAAAPATAAAPEPRTPAGDGRQVTVQPGETAGKIAATNKPANISLDQMLVAMLRTNPDAFTGGNVNRLRAGAVIEVPSAERAAQVTPEEAHQTLVAQSRDFNEFRRRLAEGLPTTRTSPADRQSSGKITAQVEEKRPAATAPDKLTLSKGAATGKTTAEDQIARDRAAKDNATRVAELNKNIADLGKVGTPAAVTAPGAVAASGAKPGVAVPLGAPATAVAPATTTAASKPASPAPAVAAAPATPTPAATASAASPTTPAAVAATATPASTPLAATTAASAPASAAAPASAPATPTTLAAASSPTPAALASAAAPKPAAKPAAAAETSFIDDMIENPVVPATVGTVLALLLGFGLYRAQQRKKSTQVDSSFLESRLQPDSFFGASGGQRIDTNEGGVTGSSMVYSPSQLDAAGDVDPVAEADVYLAYGRDLQAEEILKEAMRTQPQRVAIHCKLLEIYAKRRDAKAFEVVAAEAHKLTGGQGPEWEHICELGQELDASNALYRPGGQPSESAAAAAVATAPMAAFGSTTATEAYPHAEDSASPDIDLDLDFSLGDDEPAAPAATDTSHQSTQAVHAQPEAFEPMPTLDMDFDSPAATLDLPIESEASQPARLDAPDLNIDENALSFDLDVPPQAAAPAPAPAAAPDAGMIEFDLGALSLDLPGTQATSAPTAPAVPDVDDGPDSTAGAPLSTAGFDMEPGDDPLATKLALAQEFNAIGDPDGARSLAQEVVAEASGDLKSAAQKFLAEIS